MALALLLVQRVTEHRRDQALITTMGVGLLALGTMPLLMVWSRPEQPIALAAVGALLVAFADSPSGALSASTTRQAWTRSLGIWALNCIAVSYHMKGLFLLPLMLACLWFASRGREAIAPRVLAGLLTLATTLSATVYWRNRLSCPDDPILAEIYGKNNLSGAISRISSFDEAAGILHQMADNAGIFSYLADTGPQTNPLSFWLEHGQIGEQASFYWFLAICLAWSLALLGAGGVASLGWCGAGARGGWIPSRCWHSWRSSS
jgi:hypothetical protein